MLQYNFSLALNSLKERPGLTFLMVLTIAVGLGLFTTIQTISYYSSDIPIQHKSQNIYLVTMDHRETSADPIERPTQMPDTTYKDVMNLINAPVPGVSYTINWNSYGVINRDADTETAVRSEILVTDAAFFNMFETPFLYGGGWSSEADEKGDAVIVISRAMNDRLFGGIDSVGQTIRVNTDTLTVVGVTKDWNITRRFYDRTYAPGYIHDFFVPTGYAINSDIPRNENFDCWETEKEARFEFENDKWTQLINSECGWMRLWAAIPEGQLEGYESHLMRYIDTQKQLGRFPRDIKIVVDNINEQIEFVAGRNGYINMFQMIAQLFFAVCLLNAIGIMLAKFIRRTKEVSLRRALGARKSVIIQQYVMEVVMVGILGGILGVIIAYFGLWGMLNIRLYAVDYTITAESIAHQYQLNPLLIGQAFLTSVACTLVVSLYPIWRICNIPPASQLKSA